MHERRELHDRIDVRDGPSRQERVEVNQDSRLLILIRGISSVSLSFSPYLNTLPKSYRASSKAFQNVTFSPTLQQSRTRTSIPSPLLLIIDYPNPPTSKRSIKTRLRTPEPNLIRPKSVTGSTWLITASTTIPTPRGG